MNESQIPIAPKPSKKERLHEILTDAFTRKVNLGEQPERVHPDYPTGWVTGLYLTIHGCGARYGARLHELRKEGVSVLYHAEQRDGDTIPFYRLDRKEVPVTKENEPFGKTEQFDGSLFGDLPPENEYGVR